MQLIPQQRPTQGFLHFALAGEGLLPAIESHDADDAVDLGDDLFDDGRGGFGTRFLEKFG